MCPKCSNQGRYYKQAAGMYQIIPCSCKQSMTVRQAKEQEWQKFCERFEQAYERSFGINPDEKSRAEYRESVRS
jgi:crotonobetainyl-CoA:carnitine CoA-transferase CaiB-like acyl-CoA transferase